MEYRLWIWARKRFKAGTGENCDESDSSQWLQLQLIGRAIKDLSWKIVVVDIQVSELQPSQQEYLLEVIDGVGREMVRFVEFPLEK